MQQRHDVLVVGGGLVGASLAIALDRIGVDVGLVEAAPAGSLPPVFDQRNLSFAEATVNALQALGVLPLLRRPGAPIRRIHVSRRGDFGRVRLEAADYGRSAFGQVVVARDFGKALEARLELCTRVHRYRPARFLSLADAGAGEARAIRIATQDGGGQVLAARLLVAADGTRSGVRTALGVATTEKDYRQTLLVARVRLERAEAGTAWERFGRDGPSALLPRADGHHGAVHAVPAGEAEAVEALDEAAWLARLQQAFGWRAGRFLESGPRSAYPALRLVADTTTAPRAVLVGNAAQTLHPIGAQGFNLGLRDALTLAELIADARAGSRDADCGAPQLLDAYVRRRRDDRERTLAFSHGLATLTARTGPLAGALRSLGLVATDRQPALQGWLVGGAMGYRGEVPALCRGGPA
jgi:2-octaprenyl-6-methoxyphenol hydroxylase